MRKFCTFEMQEKYAKETGFFFLVVFLCIFGSGPFNLPQFYLNSVIWIKISALFFQSDKIFKSFVKYSVGWQDKVGCMIIAQYDSVIIIIRLVEFQYLILFCINVKLVLWLYVYQWMYYILQNETGRFCGEIP